MNGLKADGIAGDKTWNSIYRQKKKKEETDSFLEELKEKSGGWYYDRIQSIRKAQRDLGITPNGKIDNESDSKEDLHEKVRKRWENGTKGTLPEIKNYYATQDKGKGADYNGIFAYGNQNGALTLSGDTAPGISPAPIPRYNPTGRAFNNYAVSDEGMPSVSGDNYGRALPESTPVSGDDIFATDKPKLTLMSDTRSGESESKDAEVKSGKETEESKGEISDFDIQCAEMAEHVYDHDKTSPLGSRLTDGWWMIDSYTGSEGMKIGVYIKRSEWWENPSEYVLVYEGSTLNWKDWENNVEQAIGPDSVDMQEAINYAIWFKDFAGDKKVTFVGHSKGGAEAIAAATKTGCDAVVFNPAWANLEDYGVSAEGYKGNIKAYIVKNEILHDVQKIVNGHVDVTYLPDQNKYAYWARYFPSTGIIGASVAIYGGYQNHRIKSVIEAIDEEKSKEDKK